jgi:hypothetical protein
MADEKSLTLPPKAQIVVLGCAVTSGYSWHNFAKDSL